MRRWHADADVEVSVVRVSGMPLASWPSLLRTLARTDVVHVFPASSSPFCAVTLRTLAVARMMGRPAILNCGDDHASGYFGRSPITGRAVRAMASALGAVANTVVPSRVMADALGGVGITATMIPYVVESETFAFRDRQPLRPRLLAVRNFEAADNIAATIRAFTIVQKRWPDATLTLAGRGSQERDLRALAADLGLRPVVFLEPPSHADLPALYANHDIFVQSANVDNGSASMLRAFASGLPVVSTTAGAVPAILTHGVHGLLAPLADYQTLGHHVLRLLERPDYARGLARSAHAACDAWSWPRVREQWLRAYASVLVPRGRARRSPLTAAQRRAS